MPKINYSNQIIKDFKRISRGRYAKAPQSEFADVVTQLANGDQLPARYKDHALKGNWKDFRDCHI